MNAATKAFFLLGGSLPEFINFRDEKKYYLLIKKNKLVGLLDENLEQLDRLEALILIKCNPHYVYSTHSFMGIDINI